ncbi:MAG: molybdopterin-dependent oxidoreductase, partial [Pseudomonadota bacterium]
ARLPGEAVYAGSYGWASAGRFHHAQSQLKRFLNTQKGFVRSTGNYSYGAALEAMPYIVGGSFRDHVIEATRFSVIAQHTDLFVAFGGLAGRNLRISDGGNSRHGVPGALRECHQQGVRFVNVSPLRGDMAGELDADWLAPRPGTDVAVMLGLAQTLVEEGLHDQAFLAQYTVGFERVAEYLAGAKDGVVKDADWAAEVSGLPADRIRGLAREMAAGRTFITCAAALQRADWGEQPPWACVTLACILGQVGLPGGGYGIGYAVNGNIGATERPFHWAALPQGANPVRESVPVAMVSDMLLNPGATYRFQGRDCTFPDIKLVWWAGGNPFHHHQDLRRLSQAFQAPETVIVNEINWTATARHADIVLPVAASLERADFGAGKSDNVLVPMPKAVEPPGEARTEYAIYAALAARLGGADGFTEGLSEEGWLERLWAQTREGARQHGYDVPDWQDFLAGDAVELPDPSPEQVFLEAFHADPDENPRATPSGKIELFSEDVAAMGLAECAGHVTWNAPRSRFEPGSLALLSGQPGTRLHSQYDNGAHSLAEKVAGREPVLLHPADAGARGIAEGDVVELFNERGRCLAGARLTDGVARGVAFLWTGAWYDPDDDGNCRHGNPNVLTHDLRSSEWSQSTAAHSAR